MTTSLTGGCANPIGKETTRHGDEIIVAGRFFRTGTPVVTWLDHDGYDAYRTDARFKPFNESSWEDIKEKLDSPYRYNTRVEGFHADVPDLTDEQVESIRGGRWELDELQNIVDQFVIHYDVCGTSQRCFQILHDYRGLSVHFMLDVDGTIYQTLDLQERAWHSGPSNGRSVGVEIANIGAYSPSDPEGTLNRWYSADESGRMRINIPESFGKPRTEGYVARPRSDERKAGEIHGRSLEQYDLTEEQYVALAHLTATLNEVLPNIKIDAPRDAEGNVRMNALSPEELSNYQGMVGHFHITDNKIDPGPAFDWERVIREARALRD